ncbi:hypothetical protein PHLCEN_2v6728 [Hermanssonia centrifuga]|uniref:Uncharacterized protein n=1 Tax=Hermanssonia centrifuga TaxID=98765 RepID=A0A2R6NYP8_9APHY|nr:hypothetical protein PHLCEN_2v6728 [Hermanssonia centrifuga]
MTRIDMLISEQQNLKDADGDHVWEARWYKIMLSDGTELGFGQQVNGKLSCGPCPAGQGMAFRYIRSQSDLTADNHGWPAGEVGYLRGLGMGTDGREYRKHLSLSDGAPPALLWYDTANSYGFSGEPLPGNKIALYAHDQYSRKVGLRGHVIHEEAGFYGQRSDFPICLDCSFVRIPVGDEHIGPFF